MHRRGALPDPPRPGGGVVHRARLAGAVGGDVRGQHRQVVGLHGLTQSARPSAGCAASALRRRPPHRSSVRTMVVTTLKAMGGALLLVAGAALLLLALRSHRLAFARGHSGTGAAGVDPRRTLRVALA